MRPSLLASVLAAAAALPVSPAAAVACTVTAESPQAVGGQVRGAGTFACATPRTGMTVEACIDVLSTPNGTWETFQCWTTSAPGAVLAVTGEVWACAQHGPLVRTTVTGWNAAGYSATTSSLPATPGTGSCGP